MGMMFYGDSKIEIVFDDRPLLHLQTVIAAKLRRKELMFFSWRDDPAVGDGRSSIWISPEIPLMFQYDSVAREPLNREWLEELSKLANSTTGLMLTDEPRRDEAMTPRPISSVIGAAHRK
jgi:hypothetical protein